MVIGLDVQYRGSKTATMSVCQPDEGLDEENTPYLGVECVIDSQVSPYYSFSR
jgi:hypothetical protein